MNIYYEVERLLNYSLQQELICESDVIYTRNQYYFLLQLKQDGEQLNYKRFSNETLEYPDSFLNNMYAYIITKSELLNSFGSSSRDMILCCLMNVVIPFPSQIIDKFYEQLTINGINAALDYFYRLSVASNYIKLSDICKNQYWLSNTPYGTLEITINLSKPEKDPAEIAKAQVQPSISYPKCLLCIENEGYSGNYSHQSRHTHRLIPLILNKESWYFQFSPYLYYNRHSIILSAIHRDMKVSCDTYIALMDFVDQIPQYIIGANTDIPIVGGSILNHDHFQAGLYTFPMEKARVRERCTFNKYPQIKGYILEWPLSVIRLHGNRSDLINVGMDILNNWVNYSDETVGIISHTNVRHNALNPIVRKLGNNQYQLDLILRNNRCDEDHPWGIFHPHQHLHHIKKENIGLIEAMGLSILPGRLASELEQIGSILLNCNIAQIDAIDEKHSLFAHKAWIYELYNKYDIFESKTINQILKDEVGVKFMNILECSGVYKNTYDGIAAFLRFIDFCNR